MPMVMFALDESEGYHTVVETFAWLVTTAAVFKWYHELGTNLSALTGVAL